MIECAEAKEPGFSVSFSTDKWETAFIRFSSDFAFGKVTELKRHMESDEVFVLIKGKAVLLIGDTPEEITKTILECGKAYNVKKRTWHYIAVSEDAVVFVTENSDTNKSNTERMEIYVNI